MRQGLRCCMNEFTPNGIDALLPQEMAEKAEQLGVEKTRLGATTREDFTVIEEKSGNQYRFVLPGPLLAEQEWRACLNVLDAMHDLPPFVVGSGSLPPGVPVDFYAQVARIAERRGSKMILDTSERRSTFVATSVGKSFCPRPPVLSQRASLEAAVDNTRTL